MLDRAAYLRTLRDDGQECAESCGQSFDAPIAGCPGWSLRDLLIHLTEVHAFWNFIASSGTEGPAGYMPPNIPPDEDIVGTFRAGLDALVETLTSSDPDQPCWTWDGTHDVAWITRRMAHEMAVHAWDARTAAGRSWPIDSMIASDGIDEFVHTMVRYPMPGAGTLAGSVHVHCTDIDGEWLVVPDGDELRVTREHAKGSCAIRGGAHDVLMVMWRRQPLNMVDVIGDADVAAQFIARADLR